MEALTFVGAIIWGAFSGTFLMQTITSLIVTAVYVAALPFSKVPRSLNTTASIVSLMQTIVFTALLLGGNWIASDYISFDNWNAATISFTASFLASIIFVIPQIPGKILLARMSAWAPHFAQAAMRRPPRERVELAMKFQASPTMQTLYPNP